MQDRVIFAGLEDSLEGWAVMLGGEMPGIEIWKDVVTPNMALSWSPL